MKFVKRNKFTIIAIVILIVLVFVGVQVKNIFVPDEGKASYGERLSDMKNHKLADDWFSKIESKLKEDTRVTNVSKQLHGKIINIIITVSDDVDVNTAKQIASSVVSMFEKNELSYYSLQVYVKKDNADLNNFPIIGYKGTDSESLLFTKDRDITVKSEEKTDEK